MTEQEVVSKLKDYAAIINSLYSAGVVRIIVRWEIMLNGL